MAEQSKFCSTCNLVNGFVIFSSSVHVRGPFGRFGVCSDVCCYCCINCVHTTKQERLQPLGSRVREKHEWIARAIKFEVLFFPSVSFKDLSCGGHDKSLKINWIRLSLEVFSFYLTKVVLSPNKFYCMHSDHYHQRYNRTLRFMFHFLWKITLAPFLHFRLFASLWILIFAGLFQVKYVLPRLVVN